MPQQIYIPNRDVTLEYPDDVSDEQIKADIESLYPRSGEDVYKDTVAHNAVDYRPSFQDFLKLEAYQADLSKNDSRSTVEKGIDAVSAFGKGLWNMASEIGSGAAEGVKMAMDGEIKKGIASIGEGILQGGAFPLLLANSENTASPFFKFKSFITGTGTPQERYEQFLNARDMQTAMRMAESGERPMLRGLGIEAEVNPEVAKAASYILDGYTLGTGALKLISGPAKIAMTGADILEQASKQASRESGFLRGAANVAADAEASARAASYMTDWNRGAAAYGDAVMEATRAEAGKFLETDPAKAEQLLQEAQAHVNDIKDMARSGGNWMSNLERSAATYFVLNSFLGGSGGAIPFALAATQKLGDGFAKAAEFFTGTAAEAANIAAQKGGGRVSTFETMASQGSTYARRKVAETAAKYGIPVGDVLKGAAQGAVAGTILGGALGYGMEGTMDAAAEAAGGGAVLGGAVGTLHATKEKLTGAEYQKRVLQDFAKDYNQRPETVTVDFLKQSDVLDRDGNVVGVADSYGPVEINDKAARAKAVERFSGKDLSRVLDMTKTAEDAGAKVVFHDDSFELPDRPGTRYNGVTVFTGADGKPTILLNVDRMKASTASHEVFHALVGDEFSKQMREQMFGDLTKFDVNQFAASDQGRQFLKFVKEYTKRAPDGEAMRVDVARAMQDPNISATDRAALLARATEEFGAYYFENWAQNKHPDVFTQGKVPNIWENAFRAVSDNVFRQLGQEQARAQGAIVDPITGRFYKDGRRIVIPEWDALASRFLEEHRKAVGRERQGYRPVEGEPRPEPSRPVSSGELPQPIIDIEGTVIPEPQLGLQAPAVSQRRAAAEERAKGTTIPSGPPIVTSRLIQIAESAVDRSVATPDAPTRSRLVQKVLDEMERSRRESLNNNPTLFIDAGGVGIVEAPNPYYNPSAKPKQPKPPKAAKPQEPAPAAVVEAAARDLPSATKEALPPSVAEEAKQAKKAAAKAEPKPAPEKETVAPTPVQSPLVPNADLKSIPPTLDANFVELKPVSTVEEASKITQTPTVLKSIPDNRRLDFVKQLGFADEYGKTRAQREKIHEASDAKFRAILGSRILSSEDIAAKLVPKQVIADKPGQTLVHVQRLTPEMIAGLQQWTTPDGVKPFAGKADSLNALAESLNNGKPMLWSGYHEILDEKGRPVDWYHVQDRLVLPYAIEKLPKSGLRVRWLDLDQMRDNLNAFRNSKELIEKTNKLGFTANKLGLTFPKFLEALGLYLDNLNKGPSRVSSAKLFGDKYFAGDEKKGAQFRDMMYLVRDIVPAKGIQFENNPPWQPAFRESPAAKSQKIAGREEIRRPGGTSTMSDGRLDRVEQIKAAPKAVVGSIPYHYKAYTSMEANFQPADTLVENVGGGVISTDQRTGWRMISRNGKAQRLYRPDGTLHGVYSSFDEAKQVLDKLSVKAMQFEESSAKTQIATTVNTYAKAADQLTPKGKTLDYGAGLGLGSDALRDKGLDVDSYEPFSDRWKGRREVTFKDSSEIPSGAYNNVVNFSVLNVVKPDVRNFIVSEIGRVLASKGKALITARTLQDVSAAKIKTPSTEPGGFVVGDRYQKGFSQKELREYLQATLGAGFTVKDNPRLNGASVEIIKH